MVNLAMVNGAGFFYLPAGKIEIFRVFTSKYAIQIVS